MAFWDDWFKKPAELTPRAKEITQTPEFQAMWPGWTPDYKTSTAYNPEVAAAAREQLYPKDPTYDWNKREPSVRSTGGYDFWIDEFGEVHFIGESSRDSQSMTAYQQAQMDLANRQQAYQQAQPDYSMQIAQMNAELQRQQLEWQKQQWQQELEQEQKNYLAQLAANPKSWLEYAAAAGTTPAIQPWMTPLMPQEYGTTAAGEAIPGWGAANMKGMPQLTTPSAQYYARLTPTSQAQYQGYEQARTGARPEDVSWRLWNMAPPSSNRALVQTR